MKLLICVLMLVLVEKGHSLTCYKCNACETTSPNKETCKTIDTQYETAACLTQKVRVARSIEPMVIKKCVYYERNKIYKCPELPDSDPYSCNVCQGDYCNSAPNINPYITLPAFFIIYLLVV